MTRIALLAAASSVLLLSGVSYAQLPITVSAHGVPSKALVNSAVNDRIGLGIDQVTGQTRGPCVKFDKLADPTSLGQASSYDKESVETRQDVFGALGFSAAASFSFAGGSTDGALSYARKFSASQYEQTLAIKAIVTNAATKGIGAHLSEYGISASKQGLKRFYDLCGDSYVEEATTGGTFAAFVMFKVDTSSEESAADLAIKGSVGVGSGNVSTNERAKKALAKKQAVVHIFRNGTQENFPRDESIEQYGREFPRKVLPGSGGEVILGYSLRPYSTVLELPADLAPDVNRQRMYIEELGKRKSLFERQQRTIDEALANNPLLETVADSAALSMERKRTLADIKLIDDRALTCKSLLPAKCDEEALPELRAIQVPKRKYASKLYSGTGPANYSMVSTDSGIRGQSTIFIGYALAKFVPGSVPIYVGPDDAVGPCEQGRVYGVHHSCQSQPQLGYVMRADTGGRKLFIGTRPQANEGTVNTDPSWGMAGTPNRCGPAVIRSVGDAVAAGWCREFAFTLLK